MHQIARQGGDKGFDRYRGAYEEEEDRVDADEDEAGEEEGGEDENRLANVAGAVHEASEAVLEVGADDDESYRKE